MFIFRLPILHNVHAYARATRSHRPAITFVSIDGAIQKWYFIIRFLLSRIFRNNTMKRRRRRDQSPRKVIMQMTRQEQKPQKRKLKREKKQKKKTESTAHGSTKLKRSNYASNLVARGNREYLKNLLKMCIGIGMYTV